MHLLNGKVQCNYYYYQVVEFTVDIFAIIKPFNKSQFQYYVNARYYFEKILLIFETYDL